MGLVHSYFPPPSRLSLPPPPSSSPSTFTSPRPDIKYDVFLSFRGEDTRNTFTSHLYKALSDEGLDVFIDYELRRGDEISPSLLRAIEESLASVVIFSKSYADSSWCLEELVKIMECKKNHGQIVVPIFYNIDPSDVRNQRGSFEIAFAKHEEHFQENLDKVQKWRRALAEAANITGSDSRVVKPEAKLVENIVEDVLQSVKENMPPCDNKELIGIDSSITELETMLGRGNVGIWGIGGIGKTTLANVLLEKFSCQFNGFFFADVREASKQHSGLNCLQQRLLSALLGDENAHMGKFRKTSQRKKFLIILDDVSNYAQVKSLIGDPWCLDSKCRIIVTSRNKQVLRNCCMDDNIYEVKELCFRDALKLFCRSAFRQSRTSVDYKELSNNVVKMVGGVPLALTVLGSSLFSKKKDVWESVMEKLEKNFDRDIHEVLKISYEELDDHQQKIFLDIACFFRRCDIDLVRAFMKACGFFPDNEIDALIDKSLITISENMLTMHNLLQAMGKEIVRLECTNDPGKRSRLWHHKDIYDVLNNGTGTDRLEGIYLNMSKSEDIYLHSRAFAKMPHLRFLNFYTSNGFLHFHTSNDRICENRVHVAEGLQFYFTQLRYLHWYGCPLKSLQSHFHPNNLVKLEMCDSEVRELWSCIPRLDNMKHIDLSGSQHLTRLPELSWAANLEIMVLDSCRSLTEIPSSIGYLPKLRSLYLSSCTSLTQIPSSIQHLPQLQWLDLNVCISLTEIPSSIQHLTTLRGLLLRGCENLTSIPDCSSLKSLEKIALTGCSKLKVFPRFPNNLATLVFLECRSLCEVPSSYKYPNKLRSLLFKDCESLTSIPDCSGLESLTNLKIISCPKVKVLPEFPNNIEDLVLVDIPIEELPASLENLCRLRTLCLNGCSRLKSLPSTGCKWKRLELLVLNNCSKIDKIPYAIGTLKSLEEIKVNGIVIREVFPSLVGLDNLSALSLRDCGITEIPDSIGWLTSLRILHLDNNNFESIPASIMNLPKLRKLSISYCKRLKVLPKLPWVDIIAADCISLEEISYPSFHNDMFAPKSFEHSMVADLINCFKLDRKSLNKFVEDSLLEIEDQAATNKIRSYDQVSCTSPPPFTFRYHDGEIPAWFEYQNNTGSVIDVNLPPNWFNFNFLWVALCIVVAPDSQYDHHGEYVVGWYDCDIKSKDGDRFVAVPPRKKPAFGCFACISRSNHLAIALGFNFYRKHYGNQLSFQFYLNHWHRVKGLNVKKCGVHLIYGLNIKEVEDDLHLEVFSEEDEPHPAVSSEEDEPHLLKSDEQDEPQPKRFKHM